MRVGTTRLRVDVRAETRGCAAIGGSHRSRLAIWACAAAVETTGADGALVDARLDGVLSTPRFRRQVGAARLVVL